MTRARKIVSRRYQKSDKGKLTQSRYWKTEKGKLAARRYRQTEKGKQIGVRYRRKLKHEVLSSYSFGKLPYCKCCGESCLEFLTLDHIFAGGGKHRKETEKTMYR